LPRFFPPREKAEIRESRPVPMSDIPAQCDCV
jgi:hypothetical protein